MKKQNYEIGDSVINPRFGRGEVVAQWGCFPMLDNKGRMIKGNNKNGIIDASDIYEVQFAMHIGRRSVHAHRLVPYTERRMRELEL